MVTFSQSGRGLTLRGWSPRTRERALSAAPKQCFDNARRVLQLSRVVKHRFTMGHNLYGTISKVESFALDNFILPTVSSLELTFLQPAYKHCKFSLLRRSVESEVYNNIYWCIFQLYRQARMCRKLNFSYNIYVQEIIHSNFEPHILGDPNFEKINFWLINDELCNEDIF
jgi:hypothetical protein